MVISPSMPPISITRPKPGNTRSEACSMAAARFARGAVAVTIVPTIIIQAPPMNAPR